MSQGRDDSAARVLVTGATGFLAHHIIQLLLREGYRVRGTVRSLRNEDKLKSLRTLCPEAEHPVELVEADLTRDAGWDEAVKGCTYCLHVASPFPNAFPKREEDLIVPAVEGTLRVLRACADSGTVKRVVLTSSVVSVYGENTDGGSRVFTEEDWTDTGSPDTDPYPKSKTLAERAAWEFVRALPPGRGMELAVLNPGLVLGPSISGLLCTSVGLVKRLMDYSAPMIPKVHMAICDVRDVALAHLRAMTLPEAADNRHLIAPHHLWMKDMAAILKAEFSQYGYFVPSLTAPYLGLYLFSFVDSSSSLVLHRYGKTYFYSDARMKDVLKITPRSARDTLVDTVHSLIESGILKQTGKYKARK